MIDIQGTTPPLPTPRRARPGVFCFTVRQAWFGIKVPPDRNGSRGWLVVFGGMDVESGAAETSMKCIVIVGINIISTVPAAGTFTKYDMCPLL